KRMVVKRLVSEVGSCQHDRWRAPDEAVLSHGTAFRDSRRPTRCWLRLADCLTMDTRGCVRRNAHGAQTRRREETKYSIRRPGEVLLPGAIVGRWTHLRLSAPMAGKMARAGLRTM